LSWWQVIPGLVVAPLFFKGQIELGVVSQSYSAFNHILSDLSLIVNQFESLSAFSAGIDRLAEFLERIQAASAKSVPQRVTIIGRLVIDFVFSPGPSMPRRVRVCRPCCRPPSSPSSRARRTGTPARRRGIICPMGESTPRTSASWIM
jgi:hypothetical protein